MRWTAARPADSKAARKASRLMRGSAITARSPIASTMPRTEFSASLLTTSGPGRLARVTDMTSSSSRGGTMRAARRLERRSRISVTAAMEQTRSGQIGHPAACMIESNRALSTRWEAVADYGVKGWRHLRRWGPSASSVECTRHSWAAIQIIHRRCGYVCGQPSHDVAEPLDLPRSVQVAARLGMKKSLKNNRLGQFRSVRRAQE